MELFRTCRGPCGRVVPVFRKLGMCVECYQNKKYLERRVQALKCDPAKVHKNVGTVLACVRDLRGAGMLDATEAVYLMARFNRITQQLVATIGSDEEALAMGEADEEYAKMLIANGAVEAESEEQAKHMLEKREKPKLTTGDKQESGEAEPEEKRTA
jgi:hypothetical protein